ncbi:hypothetical protein P280DRAFT_465045 [Massarina eburnea CBS 473.64]|uniref:Uncharacterized protein n=1 Tax=Massarina eburnea CBS 473.64 TaxID=1395130 RepID=A0A6A6SIR8_9PLEO|nr:hypothetical protein P280DRAFT_465045 [Massarina eburnea CBS 473.64]
MAHFGGPKCDPELTCFTIFPRQTLSVSFNILEYQLSSKSHKTIRTSAKNHLMDDTRIIWPLIAKHHSEVHECLTSIITEANYDLRNYWRFYPSRNNIQPYLCDQYDFWTNSLKTHANGLVCGPDRKAIKPRQPGPEGYLERNMEEMHALDNILLGSKVLARKELASFKKFKLEIEQICKTFNEMNEHHSECDTDSEFGGIFTPSETRALSPTRSERSDLPSVEIADESSNLEVQFAMTLKLGSEAVTTYMDIPSNTVMEENRKVIDVTDDLLRVFRSKGLKAPLEEVVALARKATAT